MTTLDELDARMSSTRQQLELMNVDPGDFKLPTPHYPPSSHDAGGLQTAGKIASLLMGEHYRIVFVDENANEIENWICTPNDWRITIYATIEMDHQAPHGTKIIEVHECNATVCVPVERYRLTTVTSYKWRKDGE